MQQAKIFEKIYQDYLDKGMKLDMYRAKDRLGIKLDGNEAVVPFYGKLYRISDKGIVDQNGIRPNHSVSVVICKYLLMCPENEPTGSEWVTYKDFKDATPFAGGFFNNAEKPIAKHFAGRMTELERAIKALGGKPTEMDAAVQLAAVFEAFPKLPILLLFNDQDDEFPAHCSLLFEQRADKYLDMECLAITGLILTEWMTKHKQDNGQP